MAENIESLENEEIENEEIDYKALYEQAKADAEKWKSQSRKNESRAKSNAGAAKSLEETTAQMQKLAERLSAIESENTSLKAEAQRKQLVAKVAKETGVSASIVGMLAAEDEEALTAAANAIADAYKTPGGAPRMNEGGKFAEDEAKSNASDDMRDFVSQLFSKD